MATCYDRYRAATVQDPAGADTAALWLAGQAQVLWEQGFMEDRDDARRDRLLGEVRRARPGQPRLRAAFDWYRAEAAALYRLYGDDPAFQAIHDGELHDAASWLYQHAVELERACASAA